MKNLSAFVKNHKAVFIIALSALAVAVAVVLFLCHRQEKEKDRKLVVLSPHPTAFMISLIKEFENETGIRTDVISLGTSDAIKRILNDSSADVLWGGSILTVSSYADSFYPYITKNREAFEERFDRVDDRITCFTLVPSVIMINTDLIGDIEVNGYEDLLNPALKGRIAFADPGKSSSSFEHLVNMLYAMGDKDPENGFGYVGAFCENLDGTLLSSSSEVYEGVANGKFMVGLTFDEAAVTMFKSGKHIKIVYMEEGVVFTPDGIYISKGSERKTDAEAFVDFMTSRNAQSFIAANLGRRSVRSDVEESDLVTPYDEINTIEVSEDKVISSKDDWIARFESIFGEVGHE